MPCFAYPNVRKGKFIGCGRYGVFDAAQTVSDEYVLARPDTPSLVDIREVVARLAPNYAGITYAVYERKDIPEECYRGESLDLAYALALLHCVIPLRFPHDAGDLWCTGRIALAEDRPVLKPVLPAGFDIKLQAFLALSNHDRVFFLPDANLDPVLRLQLNARSDVTIVPVKDFQPTLLPEGKLIVTIRRDELPVLLAQIFPDLERAPQKMSGSGLFQLPLKVGLSLLVAGLLALIISLTAWFPSQTSPPIKHLVVTIYDAEGQNILQTDDVYQMHPAEEVTLHSEFVQAEHQRVVITYTPVRGRMIDAVVYRAPAQSECHDIITIRVFDSRTPETLLYQDAIRVKTVAEPTNRP